MFRLFSAVAFAFLASAVFTGGVQAAPTIVVGPGRSPGGYLPLSDFGIGPVGGVGNDTITNFSMPDFVYAGTTWDRIGMSSNGYLVVGGSSSAGDNTAVNTSFPDASAPNNVLAPFWTDLDPTLAGALRVATLTDGVNNWVVFDWAGVALAGLATDTVSFEVWIGINGVEDITFAYDLNNGLEIPANLTIGAEDVTGTVGATYYFNGTGTVPTGDLRVTTRDLPVLVPEPSTLMIAGAAIAGMGLFRRRRSAPAAG
jgi:hypothetical protein